MSDIAAISPSRRVHRASRKLVRARQRSTASFCAAGDSFTDEFKQSIIDIFNDVEKNTAGSDDCAFVKLQSTRIDELNGSACERIEQEKQMIREIGDGNGNGKGNGNGNGKAVKVIRAGSLFKTKKNLETEEDLVEYLENLKPAIHENLKEHMIRVM